MKGGLTAQLDLIEELGLGLRIVRAIHIAPQDSYV